MSFGESELLAMLDRANEIDTDELDTRMAKMEMLEDIIRHADADSHHAIAFRTRKTLAELHCYHGIWDKAFPLFARCLADLDHHPERYGPFEDMMMRTWFPRIIGIMGEFPEITKDRLYAVLDDFERRSRAAGHDLADVHAARQNVAEDTWDWAREEVAYHDWIASGGAARRDDPWAYSTHVRRLVLRGDPFSVQRALQLGQPVLDAGDGFEDNFAVLCPLLLPLLAAGRTADAVRAYRTARTSIEKTAVQIEYAGALAEFCAHTGNLNRGLTLAAQRLCVFNRMHRPGGKMRFATQMALLTRLLVEAGRGEETVELCRHEQNRETTVAALYHETTRVAVDLAAEFDVRNGNSLCSNHVRARLAATMGDRVLLSVADIRERTVVIAGLGAPELVAQAERRIELREHRAARQYVKAAGEVTDGHLAARVKVVRALLDITGAESEGLLTEAAAYFAELGDTIREQLARCALGYRLASLKQREAGIVVTDDAVAVLGRIANRHALARAEYFAVDTVPGKQEQYQRAHRAGLHAHSVDDPVILGVVAYRLCNFLLTDNAPAEQLLAEGHRARHNLLRAGSGYLATKVYDLLEKGYQRAGRPADFAALVAADLATVPPAATWVRGHLRERRGMALFRAGRHADAAEDLGAALIEAYAECIDTVDQWCTCAFAYHAAGRWTEAADLAKFGVDWAYKKLDAGTASYDKPMLLRANEVLAESKLRLGRRVEARTQYERVVERAQQYELPEYAERARRVLGGLAEVTS